MINVTVNKNTVRTTYLAAKTETVRSVLDNAGIDTSMQIIVGGMTLTGASMDSTFADLGYSDEEGKNKVFISAITPKNNA